MVYGLCGWKIVSREELYLQIESGESNFADLAKRYARSGTKHQRHRWSDAPDPGHPVLVEKLRVSQPGAAGTIPDLRLVVGGAVGRFSPATFTDEVSDRMCKEMFDEWIDEQTAPNLSRLNGNVDAKVSR